MTPEEKLKKIREAYETVTVEDGFNVSTHAYYNLEGAIIDLTRKGRADDTILKTLARVRDQIGIIGNILDR